MSSASACRRTRSGVFETSADVQLAMEGTFETPGVASTETAQVAQPTWRQALPWALGTLIVGGLVTGLAVWTLMRPEVLPPAPTLRFDLTSPTQPLTLTGTHPDVAISPDGLQIVYLSGETLFESVLMVRPVGELSGKPLEATASLFAVEPFISPDGVSVGFYDVESGMLQRVAILGGPATPICDLPGGGAKNLRGASWGTDDMIVFGTEEPSGLRRVPADGAEPELLTTPDGSENHLWPEILPGGHAVLFTIWTRGPDDAQIAVLDLETGSREVLVPGGHAPQYVSSGHVLFVSGNTLRAVGFDRERLVVTSSPVPVLDRVSVKLNGATNFDVSDTGALVHVVGGRIGEGGLTTVVWVDAQGGEEDVGTVAQNYYEPRISPEGGRVVVGVDPGDISGDLWIWDLARRNFQRLTSNPGGDFAPSGCLMAMGSSSCRIGAGGACSRRPLSARETRNRS